MLLRAVAGRTEHVHARVGGAQCPQLGLGEGGEEGKVHGLFWTWVREAQARQGRTEWTVTPEYGPGYGGEEGGCVEVANEAMGRWLREKFGG